MSDKTLSVPIEARDIMNILPHRYPLFLIDRITEYEPSVRACGFKNVATNEPVFSGHFPMYPLMPGIYMIEALAQLGGTVVLTPGEFKRRMPYLVGVDKVKFRRPVIPGDRLDMEVIVTRKRGNLGWVTATAKVDGKLACSGEIMFSLAPVTSSLMEASIFLE